MTHVSRETRHAAYLELLLRWSGTLNLVSARDRARLEAHQRDSLALTPHLPAGLDRFIDLGSGQGFPAIPIAIEAGIYVELVEADRRKAAFLTTCLAHLKLAGRVHPTRIEQTALAPADCITARALAPLPALLDLAHPLLQPGGTCLFLKGPSVTDELRAVEHSEEFATTLITLPDINSYLVKAIRLR